MTTTVSSNYNGEASSGTIPDGNDGLVPLGVSVISYGSGSHALAGNTSHSVKVMGTVFGDYLGIELGVSGALNNQYKDIVSVYSQGSVYGGFRAIYLSGAKNIISNFGNISSYHQSIVAKNSNPDGFLIIKNYGDIVNQPDDSGSALSVDGGIHLDLRNFGNITSYARTSIVTNGGNGDLLYNRGTIEGDIHLGSASAHVTNRGLITGDITFSSGTNYLDNRGGTIEGAISFGTGADTFSPGAGIETTNGGDGIDTLDFSRSTAVQIALDNSIIATGNDAKDDNYTGFENIIGSYCGNDLLIGDGQDNVINGLNGADKLYGQAGNDTLNGNRGDDLVDGGDGNDNVNGGFGNDTLLGGIGLDTLLGGDGNDFLDGGNDNDKLSGDAGDDNLFGSAGRDNLSGGDGNDFLTGGEGPDALTGGSGLDVFIFLKDDLLNFAPGVKDRITDFSQADHDLIDLSAVDANLLFENDQGFKWIGSGRFHGIPGELNFRNFKSPAGDVTEITGDTNGDGKADFLISLVGKITLTAEDFIL